MSERGKQLAVIGGLAVVIVIAAIVLSQSGSEDSGSDSGDLTADAAEVEKLLDGIPQKGLVLGDPAAPVTVTEVVDLQCPFCAEFSTKAAPEVIERYVRPGEIKINLQVLSFLGPDSRDAAEVAAAASLQNRMFQFVDLFYLNQGEENTGYVTEDFLTGIADATPGLDGPLAIEQSSSDEVAALLDTVEADAQALGANSTPTFFVSINGGEPQPLELTELTAKSFASALESARSGG